MRNLLKRFCCLTLVALSLCCLGTPVPCRAEDNEKMKVIHSWTFDFLMDFSIAYDKGYFKEFGLDVEPVNAESTVTRSALVPNSDIDGAFLSSSNALQIIDKGVPLVQVVGIGNRSFDFAVLKDSPVKTLKDLDGKKIANTPKPSNPWIALEKDLRSGNIKVEHLMAGQDTDRISMLMTGQVDAIMIMPAAQARLGDDIRVIHSCSTGKYLWNSCGWWFKPEYVKAHPEAIKKFVQALAKARKLIHEHPDEAVSIYAKHNRLNDKAFKKPFDLAQFDDPPAIYTYGLLQTYNILKEFNVIKGDIDVNKIVDDRFAKSLKDPY
jgi:NitT/TauT family transport system substrate-binding protein